MAPVVCWLASAAVLRREEDPPGGLRSHGRSGRFTPFAPIAHSGPSHRFLRPRFAGTCLRRAPPPPLARGCASPRGGSPSSAVPLPLPYTVISVWLCPVCRCRWKGRTLQVNCCIVAGGSTRRCSVAAKWLTISQIAQLTGIKTTPVSCANTLQINYLSATASFPLQRFAFLPATFCASLRQHLGRVDRKMAFCAFCVSTRQWLSWSLV